MDQLTPRSPGIGHYFGSIRGAIGEIGNVLDVIFVVCLLTAASVMFILLAVAAAVVDISKSALGLLQAR